MKAGMDFGSTLTKVAWRTGDSSFCFLSTEAMSFDKMLALMKSAGIQSVFATGIKVCEWESAFSVIRPSGNAIDNELAIQARGARKLLQLSGKKLGKFLLVSVGTGNSYTLVDGETILPLLGNPLGFGAVSGIARWIGVENFSEMETLASRGSDFHLRVSDLFSDQRNKPEGEFVIAFFAKAQHNSSKEDFCRSLVSMAATNIIIDILRESDRVSCAQHVVYIGSPIYSSPTLRNNLQLLHRFLGKEAIFPMYANYAGALGALLTHELN